MAMLGWGPENGLIWQRNGVWESSRGKTTIWGNKDKTKINYHYEYQLIFDLTAKFKKKQRPKPHPPPLCRDLVYQLNCTD